MIQLQSVYDEKKSSLNKLLLKLNVQSENEILQVLTTIDDTQSSLEKFNKEASLEIEGQMSQIAQMKRDVNEMTNQSVKKDEVIKFQKEYEQYTAHMK